MLVGEGARIWAREHNLEEVTDDFLKTGKLNSKLVPTYIISH